VKSQDPEKTPPIHDAKNRTSEMKDFLWCYLRGEKFEGAKFKRQQPVGEFTVDFVSLEKKLIIELHHGQDAVFSPQDKKRDRGLKAHGFTILRFWDHEILRDIPGVLKTIKHWLESVGPNLAFAGPDRRRR